MNLPLDKIIEEGNYLIQNELIKKIEMKKGDAWARAPRITIQTEKGKHGFILTSWEVKSQDNIIGDFKKIFGERFNID